MASGSNVNPLSVLQFPFGSGIDEAMRDELVEPGAGWAVLENGRQDHRGGYSTRSGFTATTNTRMDATTPTAGYKLFADRDTLVRVTDTLQAETYVAATARWRAMGRVSECAAKIVDLPMVGVGTTTYQEDIDATNGYIAVSWIAYVSAPDTYFSFVAIIDQATGAIVRAPEPMPNPGALAGPALLAVQGNYFILAHVDYPGGEINAFYLDTTSAATITTGWVAVPGGPVGTASTGVKFALHSLPHASTPRVALIYVKAGGTSRVALTTFNVGGIVQTATFATGGVVPTMVTLGGNATDTLWCVWNQTTSVQVLGVSPFTISSTLASVATLITTSGSSTNAGIAPSATAGKARLVVNDGVDMLMRGVQTTAGVAAADGSAVTVPSANIVRRPFAYAGRYYGCFTGGDAANVQLNMVTCDFTEDTTFIRPVANPMPGLSSAGLSLQGRFVAGTVATRFYLGLGIRRSGVVDGAALVELDFISTKRWQATSHGTSAYLTGGLTSYSDGVRVAEAGFLMRPTTPTIVNSGGSGVTGTFRYVCVYEEVDADGNWHQSGLSTPSASSGAITNDTLTVSTQPLSISARITAAAVSALGSASSVRVAFYRTLTGGVAPYYRLGTTINDTSLSSVSFADTVSDAVLAANAKLYSQPGVIGTAQDKRPPPAFGAIVSYNGMLVGATGSDVWHSGQAVSGEGAWFNPIFQVPVPGDGEITALAVMDGTLFVFKRREVYAISGEPPSDNATQGGLGTPRRLSADVGCIEPRSTCTTALGVFFQSDRGIELLSRAQSVEWIGEAVQDTVASYPVCTSATVDPSSSTILIEMAATEASGLVSGGGRTLVYDLSLKTWVSTDRRASSTGTADTASQSAAMVYTGTAYRYGWIGANGVVYTENTTHLDADGSFVAKRAVSAHVKVGGLQGLQHINRTLVLAKYHTAHDLNLSFAYDYSGTYKTARLYTAAQIAALVAVIPNEQLEHPMHDDARCEAVRVQLQDVTPSSGTLGTGQGATWIALAFEVVPQSGAYLLPDASR